MFDTRHDSRICLRSLSPQYITWKEWPWNRLGSWLRQIKGRNSVSYRHEAQESAQGSTARWGGERESGGENEGGSLGPLLGTQFPDQGTACRKIKPLLSLVADQSPKSLKKGKKQVWEKKRARPIICEGTCRQGPSVPRSILHRHVSFSLFFFLDFYPQPALIIKSNY